MVVANSFSISRSSAKYAVSYCQKVRDRFLAIFFSREFSQIALYYYVFVFMNIILTCSRNCLEYGL